MQQSHMELNTGTGTILVTIKMMRMMSTTKMMLTMMMMMMMMMMMLMMMMMMMMMMMICFELRRDDNQQLGQPAMKDTGSQKHQMHLCHKSPTFLNRCSGVHS